LNFSELSLLPSLLRAVEAAGYVTPTPIQAQAIPPVLQGRDLCGIAQTGTGKTAAFALPILHALATRPGARGHRVLVLAPTRELAAQIGETFRACAAHLPGLRVAVIFGGVGQSPQVQALRQGTEIIVATPGRLLDLVGQGHARFDAVEHLVLDEADRMLDMGFLPDVRRVLKVVPTRRQTLLFSATMPPAIAELARQILRDPLTVSVARPNTAGERVEESVRLVAKADKRHTLVQLLRDPSVRRAVVFTRTKHGANKLVKHLQDARIVAEAIHGNKSQSARERALGGFRSGELRILVATDIAARGIDVTDISHVINFDLPAEPETYVHRIGRTARAGASGVAISLCDPEERGLLRDIERLLKRPIPVAA